MNQLFWKIRTFIHHYIRSINQIHNKPFPYEFVLKAIKDSTQEEAFEEIERKRKLLLERKEEIHVHDHGAGSKKTFSASRKIAKIANSSLSSPYQCRLMYRLIQFSDFKSILELGTSLGISTAYLASANKNALVTTIEGAPAIAEIAKENFEGLGLKNIQLFTGKFQEVLPGLLRSKPTFDFVFIDGHHSEKATIQYFNRISQYMEKFSMFVIDDIRWSSGMWDAWKQLKQNGNVKISIDLFAYGILIFDNDLERTNHYAFRPEYYF